MFLKDVTILQNVEIKKDNYMLSFEDEDMARKIKMGQFLEIKVGEGIDNLLRKPISINDVVEDKIVLLYRVVGKGTKALSRYRAGDILNVLGPLGNSFPEISDEQEVLIVAGGIGCGPFSLVMRTVKNWKLFYGCRDKCEILLEDAVNNHQERVFVATDNGSYGRHGFITDELEEYLEVNRLELTNKVIFTCGPEIMMKKVTNIAEKYNIEAYVSLEEYMGCGIGACVGCIQKIKSPEKEEGWEYKKVCKDGPIFKGSEVIWE